MVQKNCASCIMSMCYICAKCTILLSCMEISTSLGGYKNIFTLHSFYAHLFSSTHTCVSLLCLWISYFLWMSFFFFLGIPFRLCLGMPSERGPLWPVACSLKCGEMGRKSPLYVIQITHDAVNDVVWHHGQSS